MIVEHCEVLSVVSLAYDRLQLAGVNGVAQGIELVAAGGIGWLPVGRKVSICKHRAHSSNNLDQVRPALFHGHGFCAYPSNVTNRSKRSTGRVRSIHPILVTHVTRDDATGHRLQLAIREEFRSVVGLAHDLIRAASGHRWKTNLDVTDGVMRRRGYRNARGPSGDLIKFIRR